MTTLPEAELSFNFAALAQLEPARRPVFAERVARLLGAHPDPGPGDIDRSIRQVWEGLWTPPPDAERTSPRWHRATPRFERISKHAAEPAA
jgi:hypothetical protein